jgi:hypothetical protein
MKFKAWIHLSRIVLFITLTIALVIPVTPVSAADPTIVTGTASDTTESSAVLNGYLTSFGDYSGANVYLSFEYATDDYWLNNGNTYDKHTGEITWTVTDGITSFASSVTGLPNGTLYHFRARVRFGTDYAYGTDEVFFTTMLEPDKTPEIISLLAYQDLLEENDCLFVILADIPYDSTPDVPVSRAYFWSLIDGGTEVGYNVGYAMNDNGYGFNIYSLYFTAADAIDWGNTTDYTVLLSGSPDVFSGTPPDYGVLDSADYAVYSDTWVTSSDYHVTLADDLLDIASILEQEWQVVLLDEQDTRTVLSSNGEKLFRNAIPGVQSMAPGMFFVQQMDADVEERAWGTDLSDEYKKRLLGPDELPGGGDDPWIMWGIVGLADWINVPLMVILGMICVACCIYAIHKSVQKFQTPMPGYIASVLIVLCYSLLWLGLTAIALIGLALVIGAGWLMFMRRA